MTPRPNSLTEIALWPLAGLYRGLMKLRNLSYDFGLRRSFGFDTPIVSVGNLTAGGTGKTPLTAMLVESCLARGLRVAIVSRGYRSEIKRGWARVSSEPSAENAKKYGDEPAWFAQTFPQVPVYVGPDRAEVVRALLMPKSLGVPDDGSLGKNKIDLIFADDAFQHRRLRRALDVVVIDATQPRWHYRTLPLGRLREGFSSLRRARAVFVTKCNLANEDQLSWLRSQLARFPDLPTYFLEASISQFVDLDGDHAIRFSTEDRVLLVSGIGRPETFVKTVAAATSARIVEHLIFKDHQSYDVSTRQEIEARAQALDATAIITTEKDAVKLRGWQASRPICVARLKTELATGLSRWDLKEFYEALDRLLR